MNFTLVNISLIDVNDEPPTFDRPVYTGRVLENENHGVTILQVLHACMSTLYLNQQLNPFGTELF